MDTHRRTAIIVGVLYIIGAVAGVLSLVAAKPILDASDYLIKVHANENQMITGALFVLVMGLALALIPVVMFPILKRQSEALALGFVVFRGGLETATYIAMAISWLLLVPLSQAYVQAGSSTESTSQALGTLSLDAGGIASTITSIVFPLGALMFYYLLYQTRLIPRWISGWGLITAIPYLASGVLAMFTLIEPLSTAASVLSLPLALQEMVMAVWLIVKGFNPTAVASGSANHPQSLEWAYRYVDSGQKEENVVAVGHNGKGMAQ